MTLYILQCSLHNNIFNHVYFCETANELWEKVLIMYKDKNEENLILSNMENMLDNFNDKRDVNHLCLMANEQVSDPNSSDDDDGNISKEEEEKAEKEDEEKGEKEEDSQEEVKQLSKRFSEI